MKTQFVNIISTDNVTHQGLFFSPDNNNLEKVVIHIHGMAGNFYENSFIPVMAAEFTNNDISFLTFNNRGHDYICDCKRQNPDGQVDSFSGGTAYEIIEDCIYDIEGAILYARAKGYKKVILQGHSSGANKVVYAMYKKQFNVNGVALISPCDDIGINIDDIGDERRFKLIELAQKMILEKKGKEFMPNGSFFSYLLTAEAYLDSFVDSSALDMFPYRNYSKEFQEFNSITAPILVTFGNNGDFLLQDSSEIFDLLNRKKKFDTSFTFKVIDGASHSYNKHEAELVNVIINWLKNI